MVLNMLFQGERNKKKVLVFIGKYEDLKQKQCKIEDNITCFIDQYFKQINTHKAVEPKMLRVQANWEFYYIRHDSIIMQFVATPIWILVYV